MAAKKFAKKKKTAKKSGKKPSVTMVERAKASKARARARARGKASRKSKKDAANEEAVTLKTVVNARGERVPVDAKGWPVGTSAWTAPAHATKGTAKKHWINSYKPIRVPPAKRDGNFYWLTDKNRVVYNATGLLTETLAYAKPEVAKRVMRHATKAVKAWAKKAAAKIAKGEGKSTIAKVKPAKRAPKKTAKRATKKTTKKPAKTVKITGAARFEFHEGTSNKFWEIARKGATLQTQFGRIGNKAQAWTKVYPSADAAKSSMSRLVNEKWQKGYAPVKRF